MELGITRNMLHDVNEELVNPINLNNGVMLELEQERIISGYSYSKLSDWLFKLTCGMGKTGNLAPRALRFSIDALKKENKLCLKGNNTKK